MGARAFLGLSLWLFLAGPVFASGWTSGLAAVTTDEGEHFFAVEIADEPHERAKGLMFRTDLAPDAGMVFVYDPPQPSSFWMKNTPLPLDIIFADENGVIIEIARNTEPYSLDVIPSRGVSALILEVNAGRAEALGIERGDILRLIP